MNKVKRDTLCQLLSEFSDNQDEQTRSEVSIVMMRLCGIPPKKIDGKIRIAKSPTADTRSCDPTKVTRTELGHSSEMHVTDVKEALDFLCRKIGVAAMHHDFDKFRDLEQFHEDFIHANERPFVNGEWYTNHLKLNRHHLNVSDGIPEDVNLVDVFEHIVDCAVAGMARSGNVYPIAIEDDILQDAVKNTLTMIVEAIEVI